MSYRDQQLICDQCGRAFIYRVEDQRRQVELGFEPEAPPFCPECRSTGAVSPGLHAGFVKWYREDKHFGFITQWDGSDIFFHRSGIEGDPEEIFQENTPVWYEVTTTDRGPQAVNVHRRE